MFGVHEVAAIVLTCVGIIVLSKAWAVVKWLWLIPRKLEKQLRQQGLQGNPYRFFTGDMKDLFRMTAEARSKPIPFTNNYSHRIFPLQLHLENKYGKNFFMWLGPVPAIHITEPELMREVFSKMHDYPKLKLNPFLDVLAPGLAKYEGEKWAKHRKLINPAFHMEKLKLMLPAFSTCIKETINKWEKLVSETGVGSSEIDVWPDLTTLSADAISRAAFGSSYEEGTRIFELLTEQTNITSRFFQSLYLPGMKYLPTKTNRRMKEINSEIQRLLKGIIEKRNKAMEAGEPAKNDLLGILMESNLKEAGRGMSFQEMVDECKLFYFAGQETTSTFIAWTMILLSKNQDWQMRAREEVLATFGKNKPDFDGLTHLKTLTMIFYEVLRLYPPATAFTRRVVNHGTKLGHLQVPKGANVTVSILGVHHDPKVWGDDVYEFNPNRFSEGIAKATKGNVSFFPFGWGPRICIGQNFSIVEAKMALTMILQRFSFELSPSYAHAPVNIMALQPQYGVHLVLHLL